MKYEFRYILKLQYLGFRFHGWAKQKDLKTVHHMVDKTLAFVLGDIPFKSIGASRTDALVSSNESLLELLMNEAVGDDFFDEFNLNLPSDIRLLSLKRIEDTEFNIIQSPKSKEYLYFFAFGQKAHPFSSAFMSTFIFDLNIEKMKEGAQLFEGSHNFKRYCTKGSENTNFHRQINLSQIEENKEMSASFFPDQSFVYRIQSKGFMRNQVRLMMGQLILLGKGEISMEQLSDSILDDAEGSLDYIAPASGLLLNRVDIEG